MWDACFLAFPWVPVWLLYQWAIFGTYRSPFPNGNINLDFTVLAFGLIFLHRNYTYFWIYGQREVFNQHPLGFIIFPTLAVLLTMIYGHFGAPYLKLLLVILTLWTAWHAMAQRYGILRLYHSKTGKGPETWWQRRRDLVLMFISFLYVYILGSNGSFVPTPEGDLSKRDIELVYQTVIGNYGTEALLLFTLLFLSVFILWLREELTLLRERKPGAPRYVYLLSTFALMLIYPIYGIWFGVVCGLVAHSIEYMFLIHHLGFERATRKTNRSISDFLFMHPWLGFSVLTVGQIVVVVLITPSHVAMVDIFKYYFVYNIATQFNHFTFDGWIWKLRRPEVRSVLQVS